MALAKPFAGTNEGTQPNLWPLLAGLKDKPVVVLRGELSELFAPDVAERMVRELGDDAELVTIPNVGHAPSFDEPESIEALHRLLQRVRDRSQKPD
jgi:pimeloyl-ACP methyl ester carboxylesterase